jgi:PBP1b-binding outer membrane lipoprotein LpoB
MIGNESLIGIGICLIVTIFIAGCASPSTPAPVQTLAPATVIPTLPPVTSEAPKVIATSSVVTTPQQKLSLKRKSCMIRVSSRQKPIKSTISRI